MRCWWRRESEYLDETNMLMFMSIPTATYNEIVTKVCAYDNIQKQKAEAKRREEELIV